MKLILASASPRRAEILSDAGVLFEVRTTETDESRHPGETAEALVLRLAEAKARAAASRSKCSPPLQRRGLARRRQQAEPNDPAIIIGADTVVEIDGEILGKPRSALVAAQMLRRLSGRDHRVLTGLAAIRLPDMTLRREVEITTVRFAQLTDEEIAQYAATQEPLDKAGAYAIQGIAGRYVERIEGCYFNVVGLPLARLYRILQELGWKPSE